MIQYAYIMHFSNSALLRTIRILSLFFICIWLYTGVISKININIPLLLLSVFLQIEVFLRYKVAKVLPQVKVSENDGKNYYLSCTNQVLERLIANQKIPGLINSLLKTPQGRFILERIPVSYKEITFPEITFADLLQNAAAVAKLAQGKYITEMDIIVSFLLLTEQNTKLLFNKKIKAEDLIEILKWGRVKFSKEENPSKKHVEFYGGGIGEVLITGWTPETKKYTQDYSYIAYKNKPQILGREKEFSQILDIISKPENNNVLIIGDPGSGRENLVSLFAMESFLHQGSKSFPHIKVLELMIGPLIAGSTNRAELESRLQAVISEVSHSGNIVLYIPEFQNIVGSSSYNIDLSGALFPYLKSGRIPVIASVTSGNFKSFIEKSTIIEAFTVINLSEPDMETVRKMLLLKTDDIEEKNKVVLTYKAITTAVEYADRYFQDKVLPGSAANLLEDVAHNITINKSKNTPYADNKRPLVFDSDILTAIQMKTHIAVAAPEKDEKELLLHLEDKLHERVIEQEDAINAIAESMRRLRSGLVSVKRPVSFLFLGPTGVGKTETAKALADLYYGGEKNMIRLDMSEYSDAEGVKRLLGAPPGEGEERGELTDKIADHPASLVLLDEFEKANPRILDLFLQVLEDGRLTDNKGKTVSFLNCIIIATSNAGAEFIREEIVKGGIVDKGFESKFLDHLQSQHLFRPELINRFDDVVVFKPLGKKEMESIAKILILDLTKRLSDQDISFNSDELLMRKILEEGFDAQFGARPLRRYIQSNIEDIIAQKKLKDEIKRGSKVYMTVGDDGRIKTTVS